jgi:hypothetical protein
MLMPSIWVGLAGVVLTAILLAADWYIWDSRRQVSQRLAAQPAHCLVAEGKQILHVPSASGRELIATLAPQSPDRNVVSFEHVHGE